MIQTNLQNTSGLADSEKKPMAAGGKDGGKGQWGSVGWAVHTAVFKM